MAEHSAPLSDHALPTELAEIVTHAGTAATAADTIIGLRELLLALTLQEPRMVFSAARALGIDATRFVWALSEWVVEPFPAAVGARNEGMRSEKQGRYPQLRSSHVILESRML